MKILTPELLAITLKHWFGKSILQPSEDIYLDLNVFSQALDIFKSDYGRYYEGETDLNKINIRAELQGILLYRIARIYFIAGNPICDEYAALGRFLSGFELYYSAEIGEGLKINHGIATIVGARCKLGKNITLHHSITLGDKDHKRPTIGDGVLIYPGSLILGGITIGNNSVVAANSVCMKDIPANSVIAGTPARIIHMSK